MTTATIGPFEFELEMLKGDKGDPGPAGMGASIPGGRLTLVSGEPEMPQNADYSSTMMYYAPFESDTIRIFDGTNWVSHVFTSGPLDPVGLSMSGGAKWTVDPTPDPFGINDERDSFVVIADGVPRLATGGIWPGYDTASRGLIRRNGIWVNSASVTLDLSATETITVDANCATWVGSINPTSEGVLTATFTLGQNRRCDVWNVYHRRKIKLQVMQPPVGGALVQFTPTNQFTTSWVAFNNDAANNGTRLVGLPSEVEYRYFQRYFTNTSAVLGAAFHVICRGSVSLTTVVGNYGAYSSDALGVLSGNSSVASYDEGAAIGAEKFIMAVGNANNNGAANVTMWGGYPAGNTPPESANVMRISYLG